METKGEGQQIVKETQFKLQIQQLKAPDSPMGVLRTWGLKKEKSRLEFTLMPYRLNQKCIVPWF